jgi:uncharacterized protein (DUF1697 family)
VSPASTPRYIAFLRAINVGGHTVTMDRLRALFTACGLSAVETFIASGNVTFESRSKNAGDLERRIERHLRVALGYEVRTFIRSDSELGRVSAHQPVPAAEMVATGNGVYVAFLQGKPDRASGARLLALRTREDEFHLNGRELYWLRRGKFSDSRITGALLEKTLGMAATVRNLTTIRKLASKYAAPG